MKNIQIRFSNSWWQQIEVLPRITVLYLPVFKGISIEWLWWGVSIAKNDDKE